MTQFYFGSSEKPLYGVFHPAQSPAARAPAILLCNPFGAEAVRAFRIFRILAERFAQQGSPVLRFDYLGSGDSSGACEEFTLQNAAQDILTAHQELADMTGANRIAWVGLRLGACLALLASQQKPRGLRELCLWDPVVSGTSYMAELYQAHISELSRVFDQPESTIVSQRKDTDLSAEALGFLVPESLRDYSLEAVTVRPARSVSIVSGDLDPKFVGHLEGLGSQTTFYKDDDSQSWNSDASLNAFMVPRKTLEIILNTLGAAR